LSRIRDKFDQLKSQGKPALMPFISAGDPNMETSYSLLLEMECQGADIVELGIPFSDPIADGPTIQRASQRSLQNGTTVDDVLELVRRLRQKSQLPLVLMTYYNLVYHYGEEQFVKAAVSAGADGLIVPDLPPEEAGNLLKCADAQGLGIIFLLAPTSTPDRIELVSRASRGFIYYVSLTGITGARGELAKGIKEQVAAIRAQTDKPIAVGFGVSTAEQAAQIATWADGVIVGSALINVIEDYLEDEQMLVKKVGEFTRSLKQGILGAGTDAT
jgi:tryptophan synthase alpha chain